MENRCSHPYIKTRKGPTVGGQFSSNPTPFYTRQSSRENNTRKTITPCGLYQPNYSRTTWITTSHKLLMVVETMKSGFRKHKSTGADSLDIQKAFN
ncbi:hypothetical protein TNCV_3300311 [Trichonephila clavipes]|nr:hypothetical protein TNCV_3300311 [Trichonephila clavipes]